MSRPNTLVTPETAAILIDAIDCINDGFALYDADDALVFANRAYRDMHASIKDLIKPGVHFETLVRTGRDCGEEPDVSDRLARHKPRTACPPFTCSAKNG